MIGAHFMVRPVKPDAAFRFEQSYVFDTRVKAVEFMEARVGPLEIVEVCAHCHRAMYAYSIEFFPARNDYRCSECRWALVISLLKDSQDPEKQKRIEAAERAVEEAAIEEESTRDTSEFQASGMKWHKPLNPKEKP